VFVYNANDETEEIGVLGASVECLQALRVIGEELEASTTTGCIEQSNIRYCLIKNSTEQTARSTEHIRLTQLHCLQRIISVAYVMVKCPENRKSLSITIA